MIKYLFQRLMGMNLGGIFGFLAIVGLVGLTGFILMARVVNTAPAQCASCHPVVTAMWENSGSHPADKVTCSQCHDQDVELGSNLFSYLRDIAIPEKFSADPARIEPRCLECHADIPEAAEEVKKLIRINHKVHLSAPLVVAGEPIELACLDCHGSLVHDHAAQPTYRPVMAGCFAGACHAEDRNSDNCRRCHYQQLLETAVEE